MAETNANWAADSKREPGLFWVAVTNVAKALVVGTVGGLATFVYNNASLMTVDVDPRVALGLAALAGMFAHLLADDLRESIRIGLAAFLVGGVVFTVAWISPLWILSYTKAARDILLPKMVGEAVTAAFLTYTAVFLGTYLGTVCVDGYYE
jgi:hypothetical protein